MKKSVEKKAANPNEMPLSWMWHERDYDLGKKLAEIENSFEDNYDYGEADRHAGPIDIHIQKELDRIQRIAHYEDTIYRLHDAIEKEMNLGIYDLKEDKNNEEIEIEDDNAF